MRQQDFFLRIQPQQQTLMQQYGIAAIYLFGSVARDEARPDSDVDLLVDFNRPIGLFEFIQLQNYLERLLDCPVDLATRRSLKDQVKDRILREAIHVV